jgi:hypothetical protein
VLLGVWKTTCSANINVASSCASIWLLPEFYFTNLNTLSAVHLFATFTLVDEIFVITRGAVWFFTCPAVRKRLQTLFAHRRLYEFYGRDAVDDLFHIA